MRQLLPLVLFASLAFAQSQSPSLPTTWVDNEELTCQLTSSCYPGSPALTTPYTAPAYELALGSNSWISGPPPSYCSFSTSKPLYAATAAGKQSAINDMEACRTAGIANGQAIGIILDVPPGTYTSANGVVIPQTSNVPATAPLIIRSTMDSTLLTLPEPVCAGGIQDNVAESTNIGLINSDCQAGAGGGTFGYQLGTTVTTLSSGSFKLANGVKTSSTKYNYLQYMYQDECTASGCLPFQLCSPNGVNSAPCGSDISGPDHWEFEDGGAALAPGNTTDNNIIYTGNTVGATAISQFASHIHFRRYWVHGDWTTLTAGSNSMTNGFNLSGCYYCSVVGSQVSQALRPGSEGHAILGQGLVLKVDNNWLEGESSGVFSGGFGTPPTIIGFVPFQDVQMSRIRNTFPYSWLGQLTIPTGNPTKWSGKSLVRKNCEELKEGERILIYGLICENVDNSGGQRGVVTSLNVRNTSGGGATPQNYQSTINDLSIQSAIYRNACEGFGMDGRSASSSGNGGGVSYSMDRVALNNILQYDITQTGPGCPTTTTGMQITNGGGGQVWQGTITENAAGTGATFVANCSQDAGGCLGQVGSYAITNSGTSCSAGTLTISSPPTGGTKAAASYSCTGNSITSVTITTPGTYYTSNPQVTGFSSVCTGCAVTLKLNTTPVSPSTALGFQVMDIDAGDPLGISNCSVVPAFNLQTKNWSNGYYWPTEVQAVATTSTTPWAGAFDPGGVTVSYNWTATGGAVDNGGYCTLTNGEGGPENLTINHMTFITDAQDSIGEGPSASNGPTFIHNSTFVNSIMLSAGGKGNCGGSTCAGWWNSAFSQGEGNLTETYGYDTSSLTAAWMVWPGRIYTNYYEYANNPTFLDAECAATTGNWKPNAGGSTPNIGGCNPPNSMFFPATPYCTGANPSYGGPGTGCVGFSGAMSTSSMPLALSDYHGYQLVGGSTPSYFHNAASDGLDIGAIIPSLDAAQTTTLYYCPPGSCLTSWPFPTTTPPYTMYDTVIFNTSPTGLAYTVDGTTYTTAQTFNWVVGSLHSASVSSPQLGGPGTQYLFGSWSDAGAQTHSITAPSGTTPFTASFNVQYQLLTQALPSNEGFVSPGSSDYYAPNASIPLLATPNSGFVFVNWTSSGGGSFDSNTSATANFTMPAAPTTLTGNFAPLVAPVATSTVLQSSGTPSFTGDSVTFTAFVTDPNNNPVGANGSVTFTENGNPVAGGPVGPVVLNSSGQASFSTTALAEGTHSITATYSGFSSLSLSYLASSGGTSQEVDNHTVVTGTQYCNQGPVALTAGSAGTPYPSKIFVTGANSSATGVTLILNQITSSDIQALSLLLVSPSGKKFVPLANAGDSSSISGVNVTLNDAAANTLPSGTPLTGGSFKPGSFVGSAVTFAAPAPAGPYDYAASDGAGTFVSEFNGSNPNGTWELFAQTGSGGGGTIGGGWCVNLPVISPVWSVTKSHTGNFTPGQTGSWSIAVSNTAIGSTSSGTVTVTDSLSNGYTVNGASGTDWNCSGSGTSAMSCTNSDAISGGASLATITLNVNVPSNSPGSVQNTASASGGGAAQSANSNTDTVTVNQAATITSGNSATFVVGTAGSFTVTTTGTPTASVGEMGALPGGVTFTDNHDGTGTLSGAPTTNGVFSISLSAQNGIGAAATQTFTLTVNQAPAISSANNTAFLFGAAGSFTVTTNGYPAPSLSETGALPYGVTFADNHNGTGTLSGIPLANGVYSVSFSAQNGVGSTATQTFTLTVDQAAAITSLNGATFTPGTASTFTVTTSGYPIPSLGESGDLPDGVTFVDNHDGTGTLSGSSATNGVYGVTFTAQNGIGSQATQSFTLTVNQAAAINSPNTATFLVGTAGTFRVTTAGFPLPSISENGALPDGVTFADNGDGTGTLDGTPTASGVYSISFTAQNGVGTATQTFTLTVNETPAIQSADNATFTVGTAGTFTVTATGYPTPSLGETGSLPNGVSFADNHDGTGTLSGTPTEGGVYSIGFAAQNGTGSPVTQAFTLTVNEAPGITSANSATFTVGTAGTFTVRTTGYPAPSLSETGTLPGGVTFVDNKDGTGTLSGTATAGGVFSISFTANNGINPQASQNFALTVNQAPAITSANATTFTVGTAGTFPVTTTGYPTPSLSETGALPSGVTFVDNHNGTATLSGTPTTGGGLYSISITASNGIGSQATQNFTLTVNQSPAITSSNGATFTVGTTGTFPVTTSGYPAPSLGETGALPSGVTFVDNHNGTATLSGTPSTGGGQYSISITAGNGIGSQAAQSFTLTVNQAPAITSANNTTAVVGTAGSFPVTATGYPMPSLGESGTLPGGMSFTDNHNGTGTLSGTPTANGVFSISFTAQNGVAPNATQPFTLTVNQAPAIGSLNNTTFTVGTAGLFTVTTTGYPAPSLNETGTLPGSVTFVDNHNGTATLSGNPTAGGVYSISITAQNGIGSQATQSFTLTVNQAPAVTSANTTTFVVGTAGSFPVNTTGYPAASIGESGALPGGVTFVDNHNGNGTLSGTPTASGVFSISFTAQNGVGSQATQSFTLTVNQAPAITSVNNATFTVGTTGSFPVTTTGYPKPSLSEMGALPGGVTFVDNHNGTGTLSGNPTADGVFSISITAQNGIGSSATQTFTLTVDQAPAITSANNATFTAGTASSFSLTTTGYPAATLGESGALPAGVTFVDNHNGTGTLGGTPTVGGVFSISFTASNGVGTQATQSFTLTVDQAPSITSVDSAVYVVKTASSFTVTTAAYPTASITESGTLPKGLKFVDNKNGTATLSGTATATGVTTITFTASNGIGTAATQKFTVTVGLAATISSASSASFAVNTSNTFNVTAAGSPTPSLTESGALPNGITFMDNHTGNGKLGGTPTSTGVYTFSFTAANGVGSPSVQTFTLTVGQAPAITSAKSATFALKKADSFTVTTTGYPTASITQKGTLPKGVKFVDNGNGTATLSGTPTVAGTSTLTFTASNGIGTAATQSFTVTVQ